MKLSSLLEDEDLGSYKPWRITSKELDLVKSVQQVCKLIHAALGQTHDIDSVKKLIIDLESFHELKFLVEPLRSLKEIKTAYEKMVSAKGHLSKNIETLKASTAALKKAIMMADKTSATHHEKLSTLVNLLDGHVDLPTKTKYELEFNFTAKPSIFGTTLLLDMLGHEHYEQIIKLDTSKPLYTILNFPFAKINDLHYVIFFMLNLTESDETRSFKYNSEFRKFNKVANVGNEAFEKLAKLADEYLHDNDKALIPKILELLKSVPKIHEANEKRKSKIKLVYRGVGFGEGEMIDTDDVIEQDRKTKYVATSSSKRVAKNFALQKGHLEQDRRSDFGYLITYEVTPSAIVLDTQVLDTVYGESEILIDATKAVVKEVEEV